MNKEIQKAIEESLPAQTAGVLKERLVALEITEKFYEKLTKDYSDIENKYKEASSFISNQTEEIKQLSKKIKEVNEREKIITKRENELELTITKIRLEMTEKMHSDTHELVNKVFGHPSVTVSNNRTNSFFPESRYDSNGNCYTENVKEGHTEVTTKTQGKS